MADARLLHKKGIHGERVIELDHLEFRVWVQYVLSADDYGVMRASATVLRADNIRLEREPFKRIVACMERLESCQLVQIFEHQGVKFWWQNDWQDFQGIRYPRDTVNPAPSPEKIATATPKTRALFALREKQPRERLRGVTETVTETDPLPASAGGRQTHTLTANTPGSGSSEGSLRETSGPLPASVPRLGAGSKVGGLVGDHRRCASPAAEACARGLCVPAFLVDQWLRQFDPDGELPDVASADVKRFVRETLATLPAGPIGDDPLAFWRAAWRARYGSKAPVERAPGRRGNTPVDRNKYAGIEE